MHCTGRTCFTEKLDHVVNTTLKGIHEVFLEDEEDSEDPIFLKKLLKEEGMWAIMKDILGFNSNGLDKAIWLDDKKRDALLIILHYWLRLARDHSAEFRVIMAKL